MDFDIHQLDRRSPDCDEEAALEDFQQDLLEHFAGSPEGKARREVDPGMGFWAGQLVYYGFIYEGRTLPRMTVRDVKAIVTDVFPRKISLGSPEHADDAIPELIKEKSQAA